MNSVLVDKNHFKLSNGLIIDLELDWETQKKTLGYNLSHTTSSFGRGYPELVVRDDRYNPDKFEVIEKNPLDHKYYVLVYEYDLSKVRSIWVYNQFDCSVTLWQRHGIWSFLK